MDNDFLIEFYSILIINFIDKFCVKMQYHFGEIFPLECYPNLNSQYYPLNDEMENNLVCLISITQIWKPNQTMSW